MRTACLDFETYLIGPGVKHPRPVCISYDDGTGGRLFVAEEGLDLLERDLADPNTQIVNHELSFDLAVAVTHRPRLLGPIIRAIEEGRARCTRIREMMIANAHGELKFEWDDELEEFKKSRFTLQRIAMKRLNKFRQKGEDTWRLRFSELYGVPIEDYPPDARQYCLDDAEDPRAIFFLQEDEVLPEGIPHEQDELETQFWFELMGGYGVRTDPERVEAFCTELERLYAIAEKRGVALGIARVVGKKNPKVQKSEAVIRRIVEEWHRVRGLEVPLTDGGKTGKRQPSTTRDVLTAAKYKGVHEASPAMLAWSDMVRLGKVRSTYAPILRHGVHWPVTPSYRTPIETYRSSSAGPNMQNQNRSGGVRDCFRPRAGRWFCFADFDTLEMRTLAQACLDIPEVGHSDLAVALRAGLDPHVELAAEMLGIASAEAQRRYAAGDEAVENARQFAKIGNYGLGGGMGPDAFVDYARGYGIDISRDQAVEIHAAYRRRWSEMPAYFRYCSELVDVGGGEATVIFPRSGLIRGKVRYTAVCNGFFQHPAAMGAKSALRAVMRECYLDPSSPLYQCRAWYFGHDEIGLEVPADPVRATAAAERLRELMIEKMQAWCPDVPIGATAVLCRWWYKGAKPVRDARGRLVPSRKEGKRWVADLAA